MNNVSLTMNIKNLVKIADSNYLWDYVHQIELDLDSSNNKFLVSPAETRQLDHGNFPYPSVRVKSYEPLSDDEINQVKNYLESRWAPFVVNNSKEQADFFVVFDAHAKKILEKMLGLRPVQDELMKDSRTEDPEVIAELIIDVEASLKDYAETINVDYSESVDAVAVQVSGLTYSYEDVHEVLQEKFGSEYFITENVAAEPDEALFYICFDEETYQMFNDEWLKSE